MTHTVLVRLSEFKNFPSNKLLEKSIWSPGFAKHNQGCIKGPRCPNIKLVMFFLFRPDTTGVKHKNNHQILSMPRKKFLNITRLERYKQP